ncbi:MAG: hypothetical protein WC246_01830 [Candidatus Paceibacterota bacterium]|jgi:hypothetical protein
MVIRKCGECRQPFPVPHEYPEQTICFSCYHWHKASSWLEKTIDTQRCYHPAVVAVVEGEWAMARADFQHSIFLKERPLDRAHLPIRLVRLEMRIMVANIDVVCAKLGKSARGTVLFEQYEREIMRAFGEGASAGWKAACAGRKKIFDALRSARDEKRLCDAGRNQSLVAGA